MDKFFYPRTVAIIGISPKPDNLGRSIMQNMMDWNFEGKIYFVNPRGGEVFDRKIYPSLLDINDEIDLAVVLTPARTIPQIIEDCGKKEISAVSISSGGFSEFSQEGKNLTAEMKKRAKKHHLRFIGPNGLGVSNTENGLSTSFAYMGASLRKEGKFAVLAQSGGVGLSILVWLVDDNYGYGKFVSLGNKSDLDEADFLEYLGQDEKTEIILMYLESLERGRKFIEVAEKIDKPILVFKANTTEVGASAAQSHTAALTNDDEVLDVAFKKAGVIRVREIRDLVNVGKVFTLPRMKGRGMAAISPTGGYTVMAADRCAQRGFKFPKLSDTTLKEIKALGRAGVIRISNPLDLGDVVFGTNFILQAIEKVMAQRNISGAVLILSRRPGSRTSAAAGRERKNVLLSLQNLIAKYDKPLVLTLLSTNKLLGDTQGIVNFPVYGKLEDSIDAMAILRDWTLERKKQKARAVRPSSLDKIKIKKIITTARGKNKVNLNTLGFDMLKAYGINVEEGEIARGKKEALNLADEIGYPIVLKVVSPQIIHKSDVGGVLVDIKSPHELIEAYHHLKANVQRKSPRAEIEGVLVQRMIQRGKEVIIGAKQDYSFGPIVLFGLGGIYVELLKDVTFGIAPLSKVEAEGMIKGIKSSLLLEGIRGESVSDLDNLIDCLIRVSYLILDFPEIIELDLNPIKVFEQGKGYRVVDVRLNLK